MADPLRLVVDIQVLLSAVTSVQGPSFELWQAALRFDVLLVFCEGHVAELARVLTYPQVLTLGNGALTPSAAFQFAAQLFQIGEYHAHVAANQWPSCPASKDWYLLDLLMQAGADGLISKDGHLLRLNNSLGLPVMAPKDLVRLGLI